MWIPLFAILEAAFRAKLSISKMIDVMSTPYSKTLYILRAGVSQNIIIENNLVYSEITTKKKTLLYSQDHPTWTNIGLTKFLYRKGLANTNVMQSEIKGIIKGYGL